MLTEKELDKIYDRVTSMSEDDRRDFVHFLAMIGNYDDLGLQLQYADENCAYDDKEFLERLPAKWRDYHTAKNMECNKRFQLTCLQSDCDFSIVEMARRDVNYEYDGKRKDFGVRLMMLGDMAHDISIRTNDSYEPIYSDSRERIDSEIRINQDSMTVLLHGTDVAKDGEMLSYEQVYIVGFDNDGNLEVEKGKCQD